MIRHNAKTVLETWTEFSLDPKASNYIARVIGDQTQKLQLTELLLR
jgi:hypothetical protein